MQNSLRPSVMHSFLQLISKQNTSSKLTSVDIVHILEKASIFLNFGTEDFKYFRPTKELRKSGNVRRKATETKHIAKAHNMF